MDKRSVRPEKSLGINAEREGEATIGRLENGLSKKKKEDILQIMQLAFSCFF